MKPADSCHMEVVNEGTDTMKKSWKSYTEEPIDYFKNSMQAATDFVKLVSEYGKDGCVGKPAPSDKRFKIDKNGTLYHLADYCFTFDHMGGITLADLNADCRTREGGRIKKDALYVNYLLDNGYEGKLTKIW